MSNEALRMKMMGRWFDLMHGPHEISIFNQINHMYSEPIRHYHTLKHIDVLLTRQEEFFPDAGDTVKLAIWFHDIFYIPGYTDNERVSADIFHALMKDTVSMWYGLSAKVQSMILATKNHVPCFEGEEIIIDLDLSGLADKSENYDFTTSLVRAEFGKYTDEEWAMGRRAFLQGMLAKERIYHTELFRSGDWEERARANLERELALYGGE